MRRIGRFTRGTSCGSYLNHSHSHTDPHDEPDVCDQPFLHAAGTTLEANGSRASGRHKSSSKKVLYRVVDGPIGRLGLTEAAVGDVSGGDGGVLAGAGEEQHGAVHDDDILVPVLMASPAATLHLQDAGAERRLYKPLDILTSLTHCLNNRTPTAPSEEFGAPWRRNAVQPLLFLFFFFNKRT